MCEDVIRVMDEDATRGSALSRSLYAYLLNFMDLKKAAQQLGIHRNTLEYQVRKMNAVIGGQPDEQKRFTSSVKSGMTEFSLRLAGIMPILALQAKCYKSRNNFPQARSVSAPAC